MDRRALIEKLKRLTVERGATPAEAARALEKIAHLEETLGTERPGFYVNGWPGQKNCPHPRWRFDPKGSALHCTVCNCLFYWSQ